MAELDPSKIVALLMAGGSGTRLWPVSRPGRAKQFAALIGERTMLEQTYQRVRTIVPPERVFVNVTAGNEHWVHAILPQIPRANVIAAPDDRDTLPTLGFATLAIERHVEAPVLVLLASDNWVGDDAVIADVLRESAEVAASGPYLVSIGVEPDHASVHFGYMQRGRHLFKNTFEGLGYHEKPDRTRAESYLAEGTYDWNAGMFAWSAATFWSAVRRHAPSDAAIFDELRVLGDSASRDAERAIFARLRKIAVDHGILEHVGSSGAIEQHRFVRARVAWDDVGRYSAWARHLDDGGPGNESNRIRGDVHLHDVAGSVVVASPGRRVTVEGVSGLVVCVDGHDVLVASLASDARVRDLAPLPLTAGVVPDGHGALRLQIADAAGNIVRGWTKIAGARGCVVDASANTLGVVGLVDVEHLHISANGEDVVVRGIRAERGADGDGPPDHAAPSTSAGPRLFVDEDHEAMSRRAASTIVEILGAAFARGRRPVAIFSAGKTPDRVYAHLRGEYKDALDWANVTFVQMDEYKDLTEEDSRSFACFLRSHLATPLGATFVPLSGRIDAAGLAQHEADLEASGLDLVVHGIGTNAHLGFNEPGSDFASAAREVELAESTRVASAPAFGKLAAVPARGVTLGLAALNRAHEVVVIASGQAKAEAIARAFLGPSAPDVPASSLQAHPRVRVLVDRAAGSAFVPRAGLDSTKDQKDK